MPSHLASCLSRSCSFKNKRFSTTATTTGWKIVPLPRLSDYNSMTGPLASFLHVLAATLLCTPREGGSAFKVMLLERHHARLQSAPEALPRLTFQCFVPARRKGKQNHSTRK